MKVKCNEIISTVINGKCKDDEALFNKLIQLKYSKSVLNTARKKETNIEI